MAVKIDRIQPAGMNVRMQQGKPAYSHVVAVTGPTRWSILPANWHAT